MQNVSAQTLTSRREESLESVEFMREKETCPNVDNLVESPECRQPFYRLFWIRSEERDEFELEKEKDRKEGERHIYSLMEMTYLPSQKLT